MDYKEVFLKFFGGFYVVVALIAIYNSLTQAGGTSPLWFSYFAFLLIGAGLIMGSSYLIASQLNIVLIPYIVWSIDFFYVLIARESLWGITDYFFEVRPIIEQIISIQHIFILPIALLGVYFIGIKRKDFWKWSLVQVILLFFITRIFTDPLRNINCAFSNCLPFEISFQLYGFAWISFMVLMIFLINAILVVSFERLQRLK